MCLAVARRWEVHCPLFIDTTAIQLSETATAIPTIPAAQVIRSDRLGLAATRYVTTRTASTSQASTIFAWKASPTRTPAITRLMSLPVRTAETSEWAARTRRRTRSAARHSQGDRDVHLGRRQGAGRTTDTAPSALGGAGRTCGGRATQGLSGLRPESRRWAASLPHSRRQCRAPWPGQTSPGRPPVTFASTGRGVSAQSWSWAHAAPRTKRRAMTAKAPEMSPCGR